MSAERREARVPRRHVASILRTDPSASLPLLGSRLDDERASSSFFSSTSSEPCRGIVEDFCGDVRASLEVQDRVYELLRSAKVDYLKPTHKKFLKGACSSGGFRFQTGNLRLCSLQQGLLERDEGVFDVKNARYAEPSRPKRKAIAAAAQGTREVAGTHASHEGRPVSTLKSMIRGRGAGGVTAAREIPTTEADLEPAAEIEPAEAFEEMGEDAGDADWMQEEDGDEGGAGLQAGRSPRKFMNLNHRGGARRAGAVLRAEDEVQAREKFFAREGAASGAEDLEQRILGTLGAACDMEFPIGFYDQAACKAITSRVLALSLDLASHAQVAEAILGGLVELEENRTFLKVALGRLRALVRWGCPDAFREASGAKGAKGPKRPPSEVSDSVASSRLDLCLSAGRLALSLMTLRGMPKFVSNNEELLEDLILATDASFKRNVLCKVDAAMRSKAEAKEVSSSDEDDEESREDGGHSEAEAIQMVLRHVERLVPMLHLLLGRVKIPETLAVKLARVLLDCFSVEVDYDVESSTGAPRGKGGRGGSRQRRGSAGRNIETSLECVKRSSLVLVAVIFAKYPSHQDSLLADVHTKCVRGGLKAQAHPKSQPARAFLLHPGGERITLVSALIMFCIQNATVAAEHRHTAAAQDGAAAVQDGRYVRLRWADIVWQQIFQELVQSSQQSAKGYVDRDQRLEWKQVLHAVLADVLACFGNLEFPCSSLLLQRFGTLLMLVGLKHPDAFVRASSVELLGEIMSGLIKKEKYWKKDAFLGQDLETICESLEQAAPDASVSDGGLLHAVEMMSLAGGSVAEEGQRRSLLGPRDILQVAYDHSEAQRREGGGGEGGGISVRGNPHQACVSVMRKAVDLALDARVRSLGEGQGSAIRQDGHMLASSAKSYLEEMAGEAPMVVDGREGAPEAAEPQQDPAALSTLGGLSHMNSSVTAAIQRERARNFDPEALHRICVYLSCTQTTVASRFGSFFDRLLDLCMSDVQEITATSRSPSKEGAAAAQGSTASSVQVRSKAMKVLAELCQLDDGSLGLAQDPKVRACFDACIQDDSVSVREAAVDLISRFCSRSPDLASDYFDLVVHACGDAGTSVQRQAVRTLWEHCALPEAFPRRLEAAAALAVRVPTMEESVKVRAVRFLRSHWLHAAPSGEEPPEDHLAGTCRVIFEEQKRSRVGNGLVVPFTRDHPLVHVFELALNADRADCSGQMKMGVAEKAAAVRAGKALCRRLVDAALREEAAEAPEGEREAGVVTRLVALHALLIAEPKLSVSGNNQHYLIECLLPHLLYDQGAAAVTPEAKKADAEKLTCVLSVISSNISVADVLGDQVCHQLTQNLQRLIASHDYLSVVAKSCELLCRVSVFSKHTEDLLVKLAGGILDSLEDGPGAPTFLRRRLFVLGHLWRNGGAGTDASSGRGEVLRRTTAAIIRLLVDRDEGGSPRRRHGVDEPVAIEALRALGMVIHGDPKVALTEEATEMYELFLGRGSPAPLQVCALRGLTEMIRKEEDTMLEMQQDQLRKAGRRHSSSSSAATNQPLDSVCGEGEVSIAGTVLRYFWEKLILPLALHVEGSGAGPEEVNRANQPLKLASLELFDSVLRQGLVAPWTAVPALCAMCAFPSDLVCHEACRVLKTYILEKRVDFFESKLIDAMAALQDQALLCGTLNAGSPRRESGGGQEPPRDPAGGVSKLYALLRDRKQTRVAFLRALTRGFGAKRANLPRLSAAARVLISLPYSQLEEVLQVVSSCQSHVDRDATYVESSLDLMGNYAEDIKAGREVPMDLVAVGSKAAQLTLCMEVKRALRRLYGVTDAQLAAYVEKGGRMGQQRQARRQRGPGGWDFKGVHVGEEAHAWVAQCKLFKKALKADGQRERERARRDETESAKGKVTDTPDSTPSDQSADANYVPAKRKLETRSRTAGATKRRLAI